MFLFSDSSICVNCLRCCGGIRARFKVGRVCGVEARSEPVSRFCLRVLQRFLHLLEWKVEWLCETHINGTLIHYWNKSTYTSGQILLKNNLPSHSYIYCWKYKSVKSQRVNNKVVLASTEPQQVVFKLVLALALALATVCVSSSSWYQYCENLVSLLYLVIFLILTCSNPLKVTISHNVFCMKYLFSSLPLSHVTKHCVRFTLIFKK